MLQNRGIRAKFQLEENFKMERKEIGITKVTSHIRKSIVPPTSKIVVTQRCIQFAQKLDFPKSELFFFNRLEIHLIPLRWQKKKLFFGRIPSTISTVKM